MLVNHRFAPDRSSQEAEAAVRELLGASPRAGATAGRWSSRRRRPSGLDHPLLARLVAATGSPPRAKLGWTDVATFWRHGIPAANFGPGDPLLAHTPDEHVSRDELERAAAVLARRVAPGPGSDRTGAAAG